MNGKLSAAISACTLIVVLSILGIHEYRMNDYKVIVQFEPNTDVVTSFQTILPKDTIVSHIKCLDQANNDYVMVVRTPKERGLLLSQLFNHSQVKNAQIVEE